MLGRFCLLTALVLSSSFLFAQGRVRDGSGGGEAHDCIERGVTPATGGAPGTGWPVVALHNSCSKAVRVYYCGTVDNIPEQWRCGQTQLDPGHSTTWAEMDTLKFACVQPGKGNNAPPDPSCSHWTMAWNAVYKDSNQNPTRPDGVPKPEPGGSAR